MPARPSTSLCLLGPPALLAGDSAVALLPERRHQLLVLLGLRSGERVERDRVAQIFWPGHGLAEARRNLRKVIFQARQVPGAEQLAIDKHALRWQVDTDVQAFARLLRDGRRADAVALLRGPVLAGLDDPADAAWSEWLGAERTRLVSIWQAAAQALLPELADDAQRMHLAQRMLALDPLDETAVAALIDAERGQGNLAAARRVYRDFAQRLAGGLGIEPSSALRDRLPAAGPAATPPASGFVGRRTELAELDALLALPELRLLTLLGPGGVGKSSLARQALARSARHFAGGAWWVELQGLHSLAALTARLAQVLGVEIRDTQDTLAMLCRALQRRGAGRVLLALDNAEHLAGLPAWAQRLLDHTPSATLLLTSRTRLNCRAERPVPVAGLAVPDDESRDLEAACSYDAVRLFDQCARRADAAFDLARQLGPVLEVIELVGGLPLAIELAASWVRLLPTREIARDLRQSLEVLRRDPAQQDAPARPEHDSMAATLEGSWALLAPSEREALSALSVFEGGFTRAAAQAVAQASLPLLSQLVDRSLLAVDESGRFDFHPMVGSFSAARLAQAPLRQQLLRARHAQHQLRQLAGLSNLMLADPGAAARAISAEFANIDAAWAHATATGGSDAAGDGETMAAACRVWFTFFESQGRFAEGCTSLRLGLRLPEQDRPQACTAARVRNAVAMLEFRLGRLDEARSLADSIIALGQRWGDARALADGWLVRGICALSAGRMDEAHLAFESALAQARAAGDRHTECTVAGNLGIVEKRRGHTDAALCHYRQALALQREFGNQRGVAIQLNNIAALLVASRRWTDAEHAIEDGRAHCQRHGERLLLPYLALNHGLLALEQGQWPAASRRFADAEQLARSTGDQQVALSAGIGLARADTAQGQPQRALQGLSTVAAGARAHGIQLLVVHAVGCAGEALQLLDPAAGGAFLAAAAAHPAVDADSRARWLRALGPVPAPTDTDFGDCLQRLLTIGSSG